MSKYHGRIAHHITVIVLRILPACPERSRRVQIAVRSVCQHLHQPGGQIQRVIGSLLVHGLRNAISQPIILVMATSISVLTDVSRLA